MQKGMIKSLKAINFDLDSKALQKIYQSDNPFIYLKAYKQINKFFTDNGFVHRQWSGYISKGKLFDYDFKSLKNQSCSLNRLKLKKTELKEKLLFLVSRLRITLK